MDNVRNFYLHLLEYLENNGQGENTVTSLLTEWMELPEEIRPQAHSLIGRARYYVVGEKDGILNDVACEHKKQFGHLLEEKALQAQRNS